MRAAPEVGDLEGWGRVALLSVLLATMLFAASGSV